MLTIESKLSISGTSTVSDWQVTATTIKGNVLKTNGQISQVKIEVPVLRIQSERGPTMDKKMHTALKGAEHANVYFSANTIKDASSFSGILTIAGIEKEINTEVDFNTNKNTIRITGSQKILLNDFGITPPTAMFGQIVVGDAVIVSFDLIFSRE